MRWAVLVFIVVLFLPYWRIWWLR